MKCQACEHENVEEARFCASCGAAMPSRVESHDPMIGQVIGNRYRITGVIGEGGMGVVYVGEQQMGSTIRKVAVKTLHPHLSKDANVLKRFHRECGTVAQLEHPNTIKVYDFGSTPDGTLYIAMEFVSGRSLSDALLKEGKLAPDRVVQILRQVCGALDEAHQQGIVHRDLKPDNIILTPRAGEQDFVKVLDFGIAARTESADAAHEQKLTQQGTVLGTPPYMSPEQFTGKPLDRRSDVYSLGVMAYEMLTGTLPFEAETPWQWATQHMTAQPRPFEQAAPQLHIADGMRNAILRSLSKEADQRQPSAGQFFSELSTGLRAATEAGQAAAPLPYQATAAMPQMPSFGGAATPAAAQVTPMAVASTVATPAVSPVAAPMAVPVIAAPQGRSGGKTGLIVGLVGAGVVIVAVIVILLVRSNKPGDDAGLVASSVPSTTPSAPETLSPEIPQDTAAQVPVQAPMPNEPALPRTPAKPANKTATPAPSAATTPAASVPAVVASTPTTPATTPAQPTPQANPACNACIAAASSGDIATAASNYATCTDAAAKSRCQSIARGGGARAVLTAVQSHDCGKARSVGEAMARMGAASPAVQNALANCH